MIGYESDGPIRQGSRHAKRNRKNAGYSLVEVTVTVAIIGILAAIALPSFKGLMPKIRLNSDMMTLSNEVSLSRVRAIAKSSRFRITFDIAADSYAIQREVGGVFSTITTNKLSGSDLASVANFTSAGEVIADSNGAMSVAYGNQGVIIVQTPDGSIRKRVLVEPVGRVIVQKSTDAGVSWQAD